MTLKKEDDMNLENVRHSLAIIFSNPEEATFHHLQTLMKLCQAHPSLAMESFVRNGKRLTSLELLIEVAKDLSLVQSFCELFPEALALKDEETGSLPLHRACSLAQPLEGLIAWMARQYPSAVSIKTSRGDLPLHLLLSSRNESNSPTTLFPCDLEALVEIYPESTVMTAVDRKTTPIDTVLEDLNISQEVREFICSHVPRCVRYFQLRASASRTNQSVALALCKLLPQLTVLECKRTEWHLEGWIAFLNALESNSSIRNLSLLLPQNLALNDYKPALEKLVQQNTSISKLCLFDHPQPLQQNNYKDLTSVMVNLLHHNCIQSLTLVGVHLDMTALTEALTHNTSLTEWNVDYCGAGLDWNRLAQTLNRHNTSLKKVLVPSSCPARQEILYNTTLNRYGRKKFRRSSTTLKEIGSLLESLNDQGYVIQQGMRIEMYQLRYGLLRESPSLWTPQC